MTSKDRLNSAMHLGTPDRVPVMCQLALGHYFLQTPFDEIDIWHDTQTFGEALISLQERYGFDGILINLPGRNPNWRRSITRIEERDGNRILHWKNGWYTDAPPDDNPHVYMEDGTRYFPSFDEVDPEQLFYMEPHDLSAITYPYSWGFDGEPAPRGPEFFPPWQMDTIKYVLSRVGDRVSVHGEIFSPFSQFMEMLDYTNGLMALMDDSAKAKACLDALADGAAELALLQAETGVHAVLISSAFAGGGLISRQHYTDFVLPYEKKVIDAVKAKFPDLPVYTHTCGAIGDRLDLMAATGANGVDTLDPPPLGTVELKDAKQQLAGKQFIKGNLDPVNTILMGTPEAVTIAARERIQTAAPGGGYILSTACSVSPAAPPENICRLREAVEQFGKY
jgi:hypothetical protein